MESKRPERYKRCYKCGEHAYLTTGGYYLCTFCGYMEFLDNRDKNEVIK